MMKALMLFTAIFLCALVVDAADLVPVDAHKIIEVIHSAQTPATLVNLWATWCDPCKMEFPEILKLKKKYPKKVTVIFISMDFDSKKPDVLKFLESQHVDFTTYMKNQNDMEFINQLFPKWEGALPATAIYNNKHKLAQFWAGSANFEKFETETLKIIK